MNSKIVNIVLILNFLICTNIQSAHFKLSDPITAKRLILRHCSNGVGIGWKYDDISRTSAYKFNEKGFVSCPLPETVLGVHEASKPIGFENEYFVYCKIRGDRFITYSVNEKVCQLIKTQEYDQMLPLEGGLLAAYVSNEKLIVDSYNIEKETQQFELLKKLPVNWKLKSLASTLDLSTIFAASKFKIYQFCDQKLTNEYCLPKGAKNPRLLMMSPDGSSIFGEYEASNTAERDEYKFFSINNGQITWLGSHVSNRAQGCYSLDYSHCQTGDYIHIRTLKDIEQKSSAHHPLSPQLEKHRQKVVSAVYFLDSPLRPIVLNDEPADGSSYNRDDTALLESIEPIYKSNGKIEEFFWAHTSGWQTAKKYLSEHKGIQRELAKHQYCHAHKSGTGGYLGFVMNLEGEQKQYRLFDCSIARIEPLSEQDSTSNLIAHTSDATGKNILYQQIKNGNASCGIVSLEPRASSEIESSEHDKIKQHFKAITLYAPHLVAGDFVKADTLDKGKKESYYPISYIADYQNPEKFKYIPLPKGYDTAQINSFSITKDVLIGSCSNEKSIQSCWWKIDDSEVGEIIPTGSFFSQANAASWDGNVVVGFCTLPLKIYHDEASDRSNLLGSQRVNAYVWAKGWKGIVHLPHLFRADMSEARYVSSDGQLYAGQSGSKPCYWTWEESLPPSNIDQPLDDSSSASSAKSALLPKSLASKSWEWSSKKTPKIRIYRLGHGEFNDKSEYQLDTDRGEVVHGSGDGKVLVGNLNSQGYIWRLNDQGKYEGISITDFMAEARLKKPKSVVAINNVTWVSPRKNIYLLTTRMEDGTVKSYRLTLND